MTTQVFECENTACTLGIRGNGGRFTGGATKEQITNITGNPEPEHHGEGVCPNCGEPAKKVTGESSFVPHEGHDPYQELHDQVAARVADENDDLTSDDAYHELVRLVDESEGQEAPEEDESS